MVSKVPLHRNVIAIPQTGEKAYYDIPYKEPFTPLENGYGYRGMVLSNEEQLILCCICGKWVKKIAPHIKIHGITYDQYKKEFGYMRGTALIWEPGRLAAVERTTRMVEEGIIDLQYMQEKSRKAPVKKKHYSFKTNAEFQNKNASCRLQLLGRLREYAQKHNGQVSTSSIKKDDCSLAHLLNNEFGTVLYAKKLLNLVPTKHEKSMQVTAEALVYDAQNFYKKFHRPPSASDINRGLLIGGYDIVRKFFDSPVGLRRAAGLPDGTGSMIYLTLPAKDIVIAYNDGISLKDLAGKYDCTPFVIRRILRKNGIRIIGPNERQRMRQIDRNTPKTRELNRKSNEIISAYNKGFSLPQLEKIFDASRRMIRNILSDSNIPIRDSAQQGISSRNLLKEVNMKEERLGILETMIRNINRTKLEDAKRKINNDLNQAQEDLNKRDY